MSCLGDSCRCLPLVGARQQPSSARGASALLNPEELIHALGPGPRPLTALGPSETGLLAALGHGASLNELAVTQRRSIRSLMPELVALELSGRVVCESGFLWKPSRR